VLSETAGEGLSTGVAGSDVDLSLVVSLPATRAAGVLGAGVGVAGGSDAVGVGLSADAVWEEESRMGVASADFT
jgi:hypothetical protein